MFNKLPNIRISGENHNTFGIRSHIESNLQNHQPQLLRYPMDKTTGPFRHNTIAKGSLSCITQHLHYIMNPPPLIIQQNIHTNPLYMQEDNGNFDLYTTYDRYTILGFKSVRLHQFQSPYVDAKFYKTHFPCSKFIIIVQYNITHQYESYKHTFSGTVKKTMKDVSKKNNNNSNESKQEEQQPMDIKPYNGPTKDQLTQIRDFHIKVHQLLSRDNDYVKLIHFDEMDS